jgi:dCMP deaminase
VDDFNCKNPYNQKPIPPPTVEWTKIGVETIKEKKLKRVVPKTDFVEVDRPSWTNYFLGLAFLVSERSEDPDTKHGTILTDRYNHIIGTGYNSLPRGISKGLIANTRPKKYERMIHSEENALLNKTLDPWLIPSGAVAYITGKPCLRCLDRLWNSHIKTIFYAQTGYHYKDYEKEQAAFDEFVEDTQIEIKEVRPEFEWIIRRMDQYKTLPVT